MSVASANRFAIIADEQPAPLGPSSGEPKAQEIKPSNVNATRRSTGGGTDRDRGNERGRGRGRGRGGGHASRGGGAQQSITEQAPAEEGEPNAEFGRGDGRGRGRGRSRGFRSERGRGRSDFGRRGGRHEGYDKHSGTGKTDSEKAVHQSWGGDEGKTELATEIHAREDATDDANTWGPGAAATADEWGAPAAAATADEWGAPVEQAGEKVQAPESAPAPAESFPFEDEKDNTQTLWEYRGKMQKALSRVPQHEPRRPNDGKADFPEGNVLSKDDKEEVFYHKHLPKGNHKKPAKVRKWQTVELDVKFESGRGGRGGRGSDDRARGRGRGGRGRGRGGSHDSAPNGAGHTPNVDDQSAFPSLS